MTPVPTGPGGPAGSRSAADAEHAARDGALAWVRAFLRQHGVDEADIDRAEADDTLDLLVADCVLVPTGNRYTRAELSERTGLSEELTERFWRALGFADVGPDEREFTDLDVEAILILQAMVRMGVAEVDSAVQFARVIGSSMARIADAEVSPVVSPGSGVIGGKAAPGGSVFEAERFARMADTTLPAMARVLEFAWRRHVQAATRRAMLLRTRGDGSALPVLAVGFADMVGFTVLSQQLAQEELAAVVSRFEEVAHDTVTAGGGRIVKMIGDEAMFVAESVTDAARIGLGLAEAYADDELLSDVRVGLSVGPVLIQDGDYFGPVVNLASRMVNIADPGAVLVSEAFHDALQRELHPSGAGPDDGEPGQAGDRHGAEHWHAGDEEFILAALRPRVLKDFGRVQLWSLHRPGDDQSSLDRRLGRRWERLTE
ncbi:MAG TPA: adenylate/guanylate cyclase domain-containing protein, partial [Acidimicrobiales bacterium]|nr:adenylate/guanylate cyclase domain-containing protein [Acidimicrobiales bacterium]